jgi:hypothetical protein
LIYQTDLSDIVGDLKLMADSTDNDADKVIKVVNVRNRKLEKKDLTPEKDAKVWGQAIKKMVDNMDDSIKKCDVIIKALGEL